ncbi:hypothetical protein GGX14DRAFT_644424 [Mycena pura]|uniref:Uncharacterized protein n=1 Tax=Mycena pura TaxID=153505 RepID=A0AAD6VCI0_9AGAR|nr:hypothetical protein GGX14DRAFT_644424 [Mycena pura]
MFPASHSVLRGPLKVGCELWVVVRTNLGQIWPETLAYVRTSEAKISEDQKDGFQLTTQDVLTVSLSKKPSSRIFLSTEKQPNDGISLGMRSGHFDREFGNFLTKKWVAWRQQARDSNPTQYGNLIPSLGLSFKVWLVYCKKRNRDVVTGTTWEATANVATACPYRRPRARCPPPAAIAPAARYPPPACRRPPHIPPVAAAYALFDAPTASRLSCWAAGEQQAGGKAAGSRREGG